MRDQRLGPANIQDYAIIGDCRSAALISRTGSIDWLCWPRFDSPSLFAALLDPDRGGEFSIRPTAPFVTERSYIPDTNVLVTRFTTDRGSLVLTDLMPVDFETAKATRLSPEHELLRQIECERGEVQVEITFNPRPGYGADPCRIRDAGVLGLRVETRAGLVALHSNARFVPDASGGVRAVATLRAGESLHCSLTLSQDGPAVLPPLGERTRDAIERSVHYWTSWAQRCRYRGPYRESVVRSALALKLLSYAPSGAIIAAPTTSLPERLGGDLNWDYRYCWLRDAAFTSRALFGLGYEDEANAFVDWTLHATRLTRPELRVLYDVFGRSVPVERSLAHLAGHEHSRPVRVGNGARDQLQLDVYGEAIDAVARSSEAGHALDRETARLLVGYGKFVCRNWARRDEGIWEPRSGPEHRTHSRVLCWTALDRLIALHQRGLVRVPLREFERQRENVRRDVEEHAWNERLGSYVATLGGTDIDASLLLLPWYGFARADSPRMSATYSRIVNDLGAGRGLIRRYVTEPRAGEGAFGICGFWAVEYLARSGRPLREACAAYESLATFANDVGLFAEETDPITGNALGNFPQAFTHVGQINAALTIQEIQSERHDRGRQLEVAS